MAPKTRSRESKFHTIRFIHRPMAYHRFIEAKPKSGNRSSTMTDFIEERQDSEEPEEEVLFEHFRFTVDPGQSLLRIDKFLSNRINNISRSKIKAAAEAGHIFVNDNPVRASYSVKPNDNIRIVMEYPRQIGRASCRERVWR